MTATKALLHDEQLLRIMPPHLMSLGFDWSNSGYGNFVNNPHSDPIYPDKTTQGTLQNRSHQESTGIHTSLCFQKPIGHPLHPLSRRRQPQGLPSFPKQCTLERIASNKTWASDESVCVSSLGLGGWDDDVDGDFELESHSEHDELSEIDLPADFWTVLVDEPTSLASGTSWFKLIMKDQPDVVLWLEEEEIFVLLAILSSSSAPSLCIHLVEDDVSAIVSLADAMDYFASIFSTSSMAYDGILTSCPLSNATSYPVLSKRLVDLERLRLQRSNEETSL
jgi:hypothetical protein